MLTVVSPVFDPLALLSRADFFYWDNEILYVLYSRTVESWPAALKCVTRSHWTSCICTAVELLNYCGASVDHAKWNRMRSKFLLENKPNMGIRDEHSRWIRGMLIAITVIMNILAMHNLGKCVYFFLCILSVCVLCWSLSYGFFFGHKQNCPSHRYDQDRNPFLMSKVTAYLPTPPTSNLFDIFKITVYTIHTITQRVV